MGSYLLRIHYADRDEPIVIKLSDCGPAEAEVERQALAKQIERAAEIEAPLLYPDSPDGVGSAIPLDPARVTAVDLVDAGAAEAGL
jgi:hypothetical protein